MTEISFELKHPGAMSASCHNSSPLAQSSFFREIVAEREEIMRHKWLESEKAGRDIGFNQALINWVLHHRASWRAARRRTRTSAPQGLLTA